MNMATKTANVLARVEPEIKTQAENILAQLGVPVSTVINMLYKQIILTKSIPFSISIPNVPIVREHMTIEEFDNIMEIGLNQAKNNQSQPISEFFNELRKEL